MKSLFGDDRIHGNLVNEVEKVVNESLLLKEQGRFGGVIDDVFSTLWKTGVTKKIGKLDNSVFKFDNSGNVLKNGKKIDKTNLSNFLPDELLTKLKRQLNELSQTEESFLNYLTNKGDITIKSQFNEILEGMVQQRVIPKKSVDEIKDVINQSGLWGQLDNLFSSDKIDDFIRSINSDLDFKNTYPEVYEIFTSIPNLKTQLFKKLLPEGHKIFSNDFDAFLEFYSILEKSKIDDLDGKASKDVIEDYVIQYNQMKREIKMVNKRGGKLPPKIDAELREYGKKYKTLKPDVIGKDGNVTTPFTISNNGTITFNNVTLDGTEKVALENFINKGIKPTKAKGDKIKINLSDVDPDKSKLSLTTGEELKKYLNPFNIYDRYVANEFRNFLKEIMLKGIKLSDIPAIKRGVDVFSTRMSQLLNPEYLIKNKYYYSGSKGESKGIDDQWRDILNSLWKPIDGKGSIFIVDDKEALLYGQKIGELKPRNVIKPVDNQGEVLKSEFKKQWWWKSTTGIKGGYEKVDSMKAWRNRVLKMGGALTFGALAEDLVYFYNYGEFYLFEWFMKTKFQALKDFIRGKEMNPNVIYPGVSIQYSKKCRNKVKSQIDVVFGKEGKSIYDRLFGADIENKNGTAMVSSGILSGIFDVVEKSPTKWSLGDEGNPIVYNGTDNLPVIESYKTKGESGGITELQDGKFLKGIGTIKSKSDGEKEIWYIVTDVEDPNTGGNSVISLGCGDFKEFWLESWMNFYKISQNDEDLEKYFKNVMDGLKGDESMVEIINKGLSNITIDAMVEKVEGALDTVKEKGGELEKVIQDKVPGGGGNSGDAGSAGEY
jgi:hypothetical protein